MIVNSLLHYTKARRAKALHSQAYTVDMSESNTLTAKAVPQANGCVR